MIFFYPQFDFWIENVKRMEKGLWSFWAFGLIPNVIVTENKSHQIEMSYILLDGKFSADQSLQNMIYCELKF